MDNDIRRLHDFITRWENSTLNEQEGAQSHFLELCDVLGQPHPDREGEYQFEMQVEKSGGGKGRADVWKRGHFAWEYKSPGEDLNRAFNQLKQYAGGLENPPLLVVSDMKRFIITTNFTNTPQKTYEFTIQELEDPEKVGWLRAVFEKPELLHPNVNAEKVTQDAASDFARLSEELGDTPEVAHFLIQIAFCLFAEDIGLLPRGMNGGRGFLTEIIQDCQNERAPEFEGAIKDLFRLMAKGGKAFTRSFRHFNGGLFKGDDYYVPRLKNRHMEMLSQAAQRDWSAIEPSIFGTLFERGLDKRQRKQLGAHYTSREDIEALVKPVLMAPLEREWEAIQERLEQMPIPAPLIKPDRRPASDLFENATRVDEPEPELDQAARDMMAIRDGFLEKLRAMRVLDPACGSGNFLYVSLTLLKDLENRVIVHPTFDALPPALPQVNPTQLYGIENNSFAYELANAVVWIGYIQWHQRNRYMNLLLKRSPILQRMDQNIRHMDAILDTDELTGKPYQPARHPDWPDADVIVGNPPFLGSKRMRAELGDKYVNALFDIYEGGVPHEGDLVTYWFEIARRQIAEGRAKRAGLLATQGIRGGANRRLLAAIKESGDIFFAESDRKWRDEKGAAVQVSMVGFDNGEEQTRILDGKVVEAINADLTAGTNLTTAKLLKENAGIAYMGDTKGGAFDIDPIVAQKMLNATDNPNARPNSDVLKRWVNGEDITGRSRGYWIIDFEGMTEEQAAFYKLPYAHVHKHLKAARKKSRSTINEWWKHERPRPEMRQALKGLKRYLVTPRVSKHRVFTWLDSDILPDSATIAFARDDDYFFGVMHSKAHEVWALRQSTQLREKASGNRYTPTSTFETFPLPWSPGQEPKKDPQYKAISVAARELNETRDSQLNPKLPSEAPERLTLTRFYNALQEGNPMFESLRILHEKLDRAVFAAYGWEYPLGDEEILRRLLELNLKRA